MFNTCCRHFYYLHNLGYTDTRTSVSAKHCLDNRGRTVIQKYTCSVISINCTLNDKDIYYMMQTLEQYMQLQVKVKLSCSNTGTNLQTL